MSPMSRKITIRLSHEDDADLLAWYDDIRGKKGEKIKDVLRRELPLTEKKETPQLDVGNLLSDIRQIVDSAITGALEEYALPTEKEATDIKEDAEAENLLDALIGSSRIDLEDDATEPKHEGWGTSW